MRFGRLRSLICIVLSILMVTASFTYADTSRMDTAKCPDIAGNKYETQLREWVDNGFIKGDHNGNFRPDSTITRAEFMALVNRSFGFTEATEINYSDVPKDKWFYKDAAIAVKTGYMQGSGGRLTPLEPISRQEFAVVLARLTGSTAAADDKVIAGFSDGGSIPEWSRGSVSAAVSKGYFEGFIDKSFKPAEKITRTETVIVLDRAFKGMYKAVYARKGVYGPESGIQTLEGSVVILSPDVTLRNTAVNGDLILRESIGDGNVYLDNVVVKGTTIVRGGGENSIVIRNSTLGRVIVRREGNTVRIIATGSTTVGEVDVQSEVTLQEEFLTGEGFGDVVIPDDIFEGATVVFEGDFDNIQVDSGNVNINVETGTIGSLTLTQQAAGTTVNLSQQASVGTLNANSAVNITGQGTIQTANINAQGVIIEQTPQKTVTAPGVTPPAPGPTPPPSGGNGSGGSGGRDDDDDDYDYISVSGVSLNKKVLVLTAGEASETLIATITPSNASNKGVTWSSSNSGVASVYNGTVTPVSAGTAVITVTTADGNKKDSCTVNVLMKVKAGEPVIFENGTRIEGLPEGSKISASEAQVEEREGIETAGPAMKFIFEGTMPPGGVTLRLPATSSDAGLSYYNETREKWELQEGSRIVKEGESLFVQATVKHFSIYGSIIKSARLIADSITNIPQPAKDEKQLALPAVPEGFEVAINSSSRPEVIAVDGKIVPPAVKATVAIVLEVTRKSDGTKALTESIDVVVPAGTQTIPVSGIAVSPAKMTLTAGGAPGTITAVVEPANATNRKISWSSSNTEVAAVEDGTVTPKKAGKADITATTEDGGFEASCEVTVIEPVPDAYNLYIFTEPINGGTVTKYVYNEDTGEMTVTDAVYFKAGEKLVLKAEEAEGYNFVNWTDTEGEASKKNPYRFTMPAKNYTLTANFEPEAKVPSTYGFDFDIPGNITAGQETAIDVTFAAIVKGDYGYNGVRFKFQKTSGPGDAVFTAVDSSGNPYLATNEGYWGPGSGFDIPADYNATTPWQVTFTEKGSYTFEVSLVNASTDAVVAGIKETVTVNVAAKSYTEPEALAFVAPENFNTHFGSDYKGINVGFRLESLKLKDLAKVEIGLYNGDNELARNTSIMDKLGTLPEDTKQFSTPFIVWKGSYQEQYWTFDANTLNEAVKPDRAIIKVTDADGNIYTVKKTGLTEPNGVTYGKLFDKTPVVVANADRIYHELWGSISAGTSNDSKYTDVEIKFSKDFHLSAGNVIFSYWTRNDSGEYVEIKGSDGTTVVKDKSWSGYLVNIDSNTKVTDLIKAGTVYGTAINSTKGGSTYATQEWWEALWAARDSGNGVWIRIDVTDDWGVTSTTYAPIAATAANWAQAAKTDWYNAADLSFDIGTARELAGLAKLVNAGNTFSGKTIRLTADINLANREWTPVGILNNSFRGTFDGQNHTVSNLMIDKPELKGAGLFGYVDSPGLLKNLVLDNIRISAKESVGGLAGNIRGTVEKVRANNVVISSTHWAGGLIGYGYVNVNECSVDNVNVALVFDTDINDNGDKAGGLIGYQGEGNMVVRNCSAANVNITGVRDVGGLIGCTGTGTKYIDCSVSGGSVKAMDNLGLIHGDPWAGGVIGRAAGTGVGLYNCSSTGVTVESYAADHTGELVGGPAANWSEIKILNRTRNAAYAAIEAAVSEAGAGDTIEIAEGEYGLTAQLNITKPLSLKGQGAVTIKAANDTWSTENGKKHLISIYAGTEAAPVTISNIIIDANNKSHGLNMYNNAYGVLNDVTVSNSKGAGLIVNGSTVIATDLNTSGNAWGGVNVDPGKGVKTLSKFIFNSGNLSEGIQIWSDGANVSAEAAVSVTVPAGYKKYQIGGSANGFIWSNKPVTNGVTINGGDTIYKTIQSAIDAASPGDTINIAEGIYDIGKSKILVNKAVRLIGDGSDKTRIIGTVHRAGTPVNDIVQPMLLTTATTGSTLIEGIHFEWKHDAGIGTNAYSALSLAGNNVTVNGCVVTTDIPPTSFIAIVNIGRSGGAVPGEAGVAAETINFTNNIVHGTISIVSSVPGKPLKANVSGNEINAVNMEGIWTYVLNGQDELILEDNDITGVPEGMAGIKLMEKVASVNGDTGYTAETISAANNGAAVLLNYRERIVGSRAELLEALANADIEKIYLSKNIELDGTLTITSWLLQTVP